MTCSNDSLRLTLSARVERASSPRKGRDETEGFADGNVARNYVSAAGTADIPPRFSFLASSFTRATVRGGHRNSTPTTLPPPTFESLPRILGETSHSCGTRSSLVARFLGVSASFVLNCIRDVLFDHVEWRCDHDSDRKLNPIFWSEFEKIFSLSDLISICVVRLYAAICIEFFA